MFERKKTAAFIAGLLVCACAAAPAMNAFAEETGETTQTVVSEVTETESEETETETDDTYIKSGDFLYSLTHDGTACIEDCQATGTVLRIPEKLDGIAVTELGSKAFGSDPVNNTFTEISLPASINYISDSNPFVYCTLLKKINVAEDNKDFCAEDGILYTKSKDILICYPGCKGGTSFTVPDSVKELGTSALYDTGLEEVKLPSGLEKIGAFSLGGLIKMTSIDLSGTKVTEIRPYAFSGCSTLSDVKLPEGLTLIGGGSFSGCKLLKNILFPSTLVGIGQYAFVDTGLTAAVIPDSVSEIGYCAFGYYTSASGNIVADDSFTLVGNLNSAAQKYAVDSDSEYDYKNNFIFLTPEEYQQEQDYLNVKRVKSGDFEYGVTDTETVLTCCYSSEDVINVPAEIDGKKITKIYPSCFSATQASEIILPDTIEEIREMSFYNCQNLKKITIPASVKTIGDNAFDSCSSLEYAEFGGAEKIGNMVFHECAALKTFKAAGTIQEWNDEEPFFFCPALEEIDITGNDGIYISENGIMYSKDKTALVAYPANKSGSSFKAPSGLKEIRQSAFANNKNLESVKLPDVETVSAYAFEACEKLSHIEFSDKLVSLGPDALYDCKALKSLRLPASLTDIGTCAFGYYHNDSAEDQESAASDALIDGFTLYAPENSAAYDYAKSAGINVVTGTSMVLGKNMSSPFVYTMAGILGAALLAVIGIFTGKAVKKSKAEKAAAERKAKSAELRRQRSEEEAEADENKEDDNIE